MWLDHHARRSRICLVLLSFLIFFKHSSIVYGSAEETPAPSRLLSSLEKSLIVPGWGQLAEKRYIEGVLFVAAEVFCLAEVIANNHRGKEYYGLYRSAMTTEEAARYRRLTEKYDTRRNQFILAAAAVWAVNLVDIYLIVNKKGEKERALQLKVERGQDKTISLVLAYRF